MSKKNLEFTVVIKADEATLQDIQAQLAGAKGKHPLLTEVLGVVIKETLLTAGVTSNFEVDLRPGYVTTHYPGGGGLSSDAWEGVALSDSDSAEWDIYASTYQDEVICSD